MSTIDCSIFNRDISERPLFNFTCAYDRNVNTYWLDENLPHFIGVVAQSRSSVRVLVSQIVFWASMNSNSIKKNRTLVDISMRNIGEEIISDTELMTQKRVDSISRMASFNYIEALRHSESVPCEATLLITANDDIYCGRVHYYDYFMFENFKCDAAIVIIRSEEDKDFLAKFLDHDEEKEIPIVFAVFSDKEYAEDHGAESALFKWIPDLKEKVKGRSYVTVWYNPVGFNKDGKLRNADDPSPVGVESLFWKSIEKGAESRSKRDTDQLEKCQKIIEARRSVHQKESIRRQLRLCRARKVYSRCAVRLYSSDKILSLCKGVLPAVTEK